MSNSEDLPTGESSQPENDPLIGKIVNDYRIEHRIGSGGMGVVYRAIHIEISKRIAVKMLAPHLSSHKQYRERFFREGKACSNVQHPGLVQIFGFSELEDGTLYILMEYLEGESLHTRLKLAPDHRLPLMSALHIAQQVANAMGAAHARGIVHRDLKPDNFLLVTDPVAPLGERAKILDFGIAKFMGPSELPTIESQGLLGTPTYMAPERCRGDESIDSKSDVYALGCVLYEMLCGRPPFIGDGQELMMCHVCSSPTPLRQRASDIPASIDDLTLRMLAKSPEERPTMTEVSDLIKVLYSSPEGLSSSERLPERWLISKRLKDGIKFAKRLFMPLLSFVLILIVALAYPLWKKFHRPEMIHIAAGSFTMGSDAAEEAVARTLIDRLDPNYDKIFLPKEVSLSLLASEHPTRKVFLSQFSMDTTEVTNEDFIRFLKNLDRHKIQCRPRPKEPSQSIYYDNKLLFDSWGDIDFNGIVLEADCSRFTVRSGKERLPVTAVTWDAANEYCLWSGKRLPREAEWEFAATNRGRTRFPWGESAPSCYQTAVARGTKNDLCLKQLGALLRLPPVGSMSEDRNEVGIYDLGGSVAEWVQDSFVAPYPACTGGSCRDPVEEPKGPVPEDAKCKAGLRVIRGSGWSSGLARTRAASRFPACQDSVFGEVGFRCVKSGS